VSWISCITVSDIIYVSNSWIKESLNSRSTVSSSECNGTIYLLSKSDLIGQGLFIAIGDGIFVCARVANSNVWVTAYQCLAYFDGPWGVSFNG